MKFILPFCLLLITCQEPKAQKTVYESDTLEIHQLTDNSFLHISYLETKDFGKVPCNGMVLADGGEAVVLETTVDGASSRELIQWVENELKSRIVGVIAHHFHEDCLGGIEAFHEKNIPSFGSHKTIELARSTGRTPPQQPILNGHQTFFGDLMVESRYFGPAHTEDNIVSHIPEDQLLFGGCMIKSLKSGKGNVEDANLNRYAESVKELQQHFKVLEIVVPGHGQAGGPELIQYTIDLFSEK